MTNRPGGSTAKFPTVACALKRALFGRWLWTTRTAQCAPLGLSIDHRTSGKIRFVFQRVKRGGCDIAHVAPLRHELCRRFDNNLTSHVKFLDTESSKNYDTDVKKIDRNVVGERHMPAGRTKQVGLTTAPSGSWVQTERAAHEKWAGLIANNPKAAALMHIIVGNMGRHNALIASQKTLAGMLRCNVRTVQRALDALRANNWIEVRQIGPTGTACAYIVNDRVAWSGNRDGIRYSLFSAAVMVSDVEQPDQNQLGALPALERIPSLFPGDQHHHLFGVNQISLK
jgi:hypothetical protein